MPPATVTTSLMFNLSITVSPTLRSSLAGEAAIDEMVGSVVSICGLLSADHPVMANFAGANNTSPDLAKVENHSVVDAAPPVMVAEGATVAEIDGASAQSVSFAGTTGTLKLGDAFAFTGQVSGLAEADALDLANVRYGANTTATFLGNADGGTLTVTDGTDTAHIALVGDYLGSGWTLSSDGHGRHPCGRPVEFEHRQRELTTMYRFECDDYSSLNDCPEENGRRQVAKTPFLTNSNIIILHHPKHRAMRHLLLA